MSSMERSAVVALVFLIVTIVAVALWDQPQAAQASDSPSPGLASGELASSGLASGAPAPGASQEPVQPHAPPGATSDLLAAPLRPELDRTGGADPWNAAAQTPVGFESILGDGGFRLPEPPSDEWSRPPSPASALDPLGLGIDVLANREASRGSGRTPAPSYETDLERAPEGQPARAEREERGAQPAGGEDGWHVVAEGETLGEIAQARLGSAARWKEIVELNGIADPRKVPAGKRLRMPAGARGGSLDDDEPARSSAPAGARSYAVREGDSLWKIAARELGDGDRWKEIVALNPKVDPNKLIVGAALRLPRGGVANSTPPASVPVASDRLAWTPPAVASGAAPKGKVR